jgi:protein transport protein SEC13
MYGSILATCGYDRKVIMWKEMESGWGKIYEYSSHDSSVNSVCWAPHQFGLILACGSSDGSISIITYNEGNWESKRINGAHTIGCNAVSWGPYLQPGSLAGQHQLPVKRFVSGGCDNLVKIWREEAGGWVEEQKLEGHRDWVRDVAWAPSVGRHRSIIASCSQDCQVLIWTNDSESGTATWTEKLLHKFDDVVWHLSWSVTGNILAVSGGDNKVSLWKENLQGQWACVSNVTKGQGQLNDAS